jgi:hypothetical protein
LTPNREIFVTLSAELEGHLRGLSSVLEVPFEWLVVGIVCDTIERPLRIVRARAGELLAS